METQMSQMFLALMAQNQQLMQQLMTQNANNNQPIVNRKTRNSLEDLSTISMMDFITDTKFEFLSLTDLNGFTLPEFYAQNILINLNRFETNQRPLQLTDKKRKKMYYKDNDKWMHDDKWFTEVYNKIFKHYCGQFSSKKKNNYKSIHEADDDIEDKDIDEIQSLIGKFFDVTKYPFSSLKEKTITRLINKMCVEFDE